MTGFLVIAAAMVLAAVAFVVVPLLRTRDASAPRGARVSAIIAGTATPLAAALLYVSWSNWSWQPQAAPGGEDVPPEIAAMVQRLETRITREGGSLEDWQMLGRSRFVLGRYAEAADAYREAYRLSGGSDVATLTGYAESLALADPRAIGTDAGDLFERALRLEPDNQKALWYGGIAAFNRGDFAAARERWQRLLAGNPPPQVRSALEQSIARAEEQLTGAVGSAEAPVAATPTPTEAGNVSAEAIEVTVTLAPELADQLDPSAALFVIARSPGGGGPPFAVVRRQSNELPLTLELSDSDAMVPGRTLSGQAQLELVARVALGGQPVAQPGDLFGAVTYQRGQRSATIEINQVSPGGLTP